MPRLLLFFLVAWFAATTIAFHFNSGVMHRNVMRLYDVKTQLNGDMKNAMKNKEKEKLSAIRAIQTVIKQKEVDERIEVTDELAYQLMAKLVKQRKESIKSYQDANRPDLVEQEQLELDFIQAYMPKQLDAKEISDIVDATIAKLEAKTVKDMGKVVAELKTLLSGKADMSEVSTIVKGKLGGGK